MSTNLGNFTNDTKEIIFEWAKIVQEKYISENYLSDFLLIIDWDEAGLRQRNIPKAAVLSPVIRGVSGCSPFPSNVQPPSNFIFSIVDTPEIQAYQTIDYILSRLQLAFFQKNKFSLGKVYLVVAGKHNSFRIYEVLNI
ncbi:5083_t:CDS:2 [Funneliformis geosporum]|uniref:5445_t:CDS:1 n=1 Tax=Funneliformis geosporum TaxID=1117311 RepID=A0A9W4WV82_9GLOM|nr:5083_t:CDS:2 [Funneliformis geosporum]CAI2189336.1 5445_t:CDS:2 [Funneliformis geosporum]